MRQQDPGGGPRHPAIDPFDTRRLAVDDLHILHVEQVGNPDGLPAVFLHGGPGSGCNADQRRYFDPALFRAVLFDQRGAGRSTPKGCRERNTTQDLIDDLERLREALGIAQWMLVGGSWGATLAVAYAEAHPQRVLGLVLRAVFLGTAEEFRWAFTGAAQTFRPELWRAFANLLPEGERADPVAALGRRLEDPDPAVRAGAAWVWHDYERALSVLKPAAPALPTSLDAAAARAGKGQVGKGGALPGTPFMEWHYLSHDCFLAPGQLLRGANRLAAIPGIIVQGRYDLLCPPVTAADLAAAWGGNADLRIVPGAGHGVSEPGILDGLIAAIDTLGRKLG